MTIADPIGAQLALCFILIFIIRTTFTAIYIDMFSKEDNSDSSMSNITLYDFLSFRGFLNFCVGFCLYWAILGLDDWWNINFAIIIGVIISVLLTFVYNAIIETVKLNISETPQDLIFRSGKVHSTSNRAVTLQVTFNGYENKFVVLPDEGYSLSDFKSGEIAYISRIEMPNENAIRFYARPYDNKNIIN